MDNRAFSHLGRCLPALALVLLPMLPACAGSGGLKKQVAGLETQVTAMRADQDRLEERLAALELSAAQSSRPAGAPAAERIERPRLKVIHLSPDDDSAPAEPVNEAPAPSPSDSAHRPIIRGTGDRVIKVGDGDADESTARDVAPTKPVAQLGKDAHGN